MENQITVELPSPEAAEGFIWAVHENKELKPGVRFLLSNSQRRALRGLQRAAKRPNETRLNLKAFALVLLAGAMLCLLFSVAVGFKMSMFNASSIAVGIGLVALAGAVAALGLPTSPSTANSLLKLNIYCETGFSERIRIMAKKFGS